MNEAITAVVVDDEVLARDLLKSLIENEPDFRVVAEYADGNSAIASVQRDNPKVLFLDIEMPGLGGLDVARRVGETPGAPHIVFVTAFNQYAIDAFELNAVDYLVKPISKSRCRATLSRIRETVRGENMRELTSKLLAVVRNLEPQATDAGTEQKIVVRKGDELRAIPLSDIIWVEAANQYVNIHTLSEQFVMSESLSRFAERLRDSRFVRIHRSALINGHHVSKVSRNSNGTHDICMRDTTQLILARARSGFLERILHLAGEDAATGPKA